MVLEIVHHLGKNRPASDILELIGHLACVFEACGPAKEFDRHRDYEVDCGTYKSREQSCGCAVSGGDREYGRSLDEHPGGNQTADHRPETTAIVPNIEDRYRRAQTQNQSAYKRRLQFRWLRHESSEC